MLAQELKRPHDGEIPSDLRSNLRASQRPRTAANNPERFVRQAGFAAILAQQQIGIQVPQQSPFWQTPLAAQGFLPPHVAPDPIFGLEPEFDAFWQPPRVPQQVGLPNGYHANFIDTLFAGMSSGEFLNAFPSGMALLQGYSYGIVAPPDHSVAASTPAARQNPGQGNAFPPETLSVMPHPRLPAPLIRTTIPNHPYVSPYQLVTTSSRSLSKPQPDRLQTIKSTPTLDELLDAIPQGLYTEEMLDAAADLAKEDWLPQPQPQLVADTEEDDGCRYLFEDDDLEQDTAVNQETVLLLSEIKAEMYELALVFYNAFCETFEEDEEEQDVVVENKEHAKPNRLRKDSVVGDAQAAPAPPIMPSAPSPFSVLPQWQAQLNHKPMQKQKQRQPQQPKPSTPTHLQKPQHTTPAVAIDLSGDSAVYTNSSVPPPLDPPKQHQKPTESSVSAGTSSSAPIAKAKSTGLELPKMIFPKDKILQTMSRDDLSNLLYQLGCWHDDIDEEKERIKRMEKDKDLKKKKLQQLNSKTKTLIKWKDHPCFKWS